MSSSSYVDLLLRKGKRIAISYIISDCLQNDNPENAILLHQVADSLLNPRDAIEKPENIEWIRWLLAAGKNPDEFAKEVKRFDTATTCGLVWIANFVAYRCRTCAISPCMSLCAECFQKGEHEGHDFNMFRSQAGGACDCGDESVMKKSGFCVRHTQKKKKSRNKTRVSKTDHDSDLNCNSSFLGDDGSEEEEEREGKDECIELLLVARALMPKIINRLLVDLRRNEVNALKDIDVFITSLLNPLTSMGAAMRSVISEVLLDPRMYDKYARKCECNELDSKSFLEERYRSYVRTRGDLPNFNLHSYYNGCTSCPTDECPQKQSNPDFIHYTFIQELVFWMVVYKFPQKLVCFLLNMLPDSDYKEAFAQSFVQHYSRISMMLANFRNYEESSAASGKPSAHDLLSNCVVHVSVQLLSNENLAVKLCEKQHLLFIIIASLRATIEGGEGQESNLIPSILQNERQNCHRVVRCDHYVMKKHSYWPLVSDLNNILTHQQVAVMFIRSRELFELWLNFIINFQAMNINPREFHKHVEFENDSYYASFSSELEICATPMWTIISHIRSPETAQLSKQVIQSTLRALYRWFELIQFKYDDTPNPYQATFHLPLHRYFSVFVRHAVEHQGLNLSELLPGNEEQIKLLLAHPLQIQVNFYEILCNLWVRNGLQIKGQAMTYIQCHFCNSMIDPDLFLIQQLSAKLEPDWFVRTVFQRFHVWDWLSFAHNSEPFFASGMDTAFNLTGELRSKNTRPKKFLETEQLMPMLEGALTFLCSLFVVQTNLGLSDEQIIRQEIVTLLCMSDRTHSQLQDLIPEKCGTTSTRDFEHTLNAIADFRSPALEAGGNLSQGMFYPKAGIWLDEYDPIHVLLRAVHRRDYQASIDRFTQFIKNHTNVNGEKTNTAQSPNQPWPPFRLPRPISDRYLDPKRILYSKVLHGILFTILHRAVHGNEVSDQVLALTIFLLQLSLTNTRPQRDSPAQRLASLDYASNEVPDMSYEHWFNSSWILENMNLVIQNVLVQPELSETTDRSQHDQTPLDGMEVDLHSSDGEEEEEEEDEDVYQRDEYMHDIDVSQGQIEPPPTMPQLPTTHVPLALTDSPRLPNMDDNPQPSGSGTNQSLTRSSSAGSSNYSSAISVTSQVSSDHSFASNASSPASNASTSGTSPTSTPTSSSSSSTNSSPTSPRPTVTSHPLAIANATTSGTIDQDEASPSISTPPATSSMVSILSPINLPTLAVGRPNISNGPSHPSDRPPIVRSGPNALSFPGPSTSPGYSGLVFHTPQGSTGTQLSPSSMYPFLSPLTLQMTLQSRPFSPGTRNTSLPFLRRSHAEQRRRMVNRRRGFSEYYRSGASTSKSSTVEMGPMGIGELMRALPASSSSRHRMPDNSSASAPKTVLVNESFVSLLLKLHSKLTGRTDSYQPNPNIDLNKLKRIGDGAHFVSQCLDTFCSLNSNSGIQGIHEWKAKLWPHLYKKPDTDQHRDKESTLTFEGESPSGNVGNADKEERRRKAKERQQKLMAEFATKQKAFMKQMNEEMKNNSTTPETETTKDPDLTINVCEQLQYECVICGQTTPSTCERLVGMVVLLQSSSILAHCSPKYPLATLKKSRNLNETTKKHEERIRLTDENAIQQHKKETLGNYMTHLIDVLRSFDESSWLNAINIGWEGGVHIQSCGHYLHLDCHQSYMQSLKNNNRHRNRPQPEGNDFFCPLCRQSANSVLPINPSINRKPNLKAYLQTQRFNTSSENLCLVEPLIGVLYKCDPKQFLLSRPMALITHEATISPDSQPFHMKDPFYFSNETSDSNLSLSIATGLKSDGNIDQVLLENCAQLIELYNRCPPPDRPFIQSLNHFSGDLTTATTPQYRSVLHEPTPHSLYLYICSILRTNLECELLVRVSGFIPTGSKKSCVLPLFHALAVNAHVLIPHHYTPLWSGISGLEVPERMRSMLFQPQNAVPFLLMDASALLIQLIFALPLNVDSTIFDTIVQILYNLVATQAVAQLCFTFNDDERSELRNKLHTLPKDTELHTLRGLLGQVMDTLESANGNLFTCLQDEEENAPRSAWLDSELSGAAKQMCLPFLRLASLLKSHLYAQEYPSHVKLSEYEVLCGMLNLHTPDRLSSQDFGFRLPYFVCQTPKLLLSTWLNQYLHFVDKSLIDANRLLHCRPVHFTSPRLLSLPSTYDQIFLHYYQKPCSKCNTCPKEPCICLLCATLVCMRDDCCKRTEGLAFEATHHASICGAGTALYLAVHSSSVIVIRGKRACVWGSVYLDMHGEEDRDLKRGRPLYLSELRFAVLEQQWLTHSFDHTNKRWVWHKDLL